MRVTAKDVAKVADVSTSVVSLVLNDKDSGRVSARTRQRVLEVAAELGYRIDSQARGLATGRTGFVGYAAPDVNTFFMDLQIGLLESLNPDYQLMTVTTDLKSSDARHNLSQLLALNPDALVVSTVDPARIRELRPHCPVLILDAPEVHSDYPRINLDQERTAAEVAAHLLALGHRRFAHLDIDGGSSSVLSRRRAFLDAVDSSGLDCEVVEARSEVDGNAARVVVLERWAQWAARRVSAIVCGSDQQAYGAIAALDELGLGVPGDVSVVGAQDEPFSRITRPALTTVRVPAREMGVRAGRTIRAMVDGQGAPAVEVLKTTLVLRESTGPTPTAVA